MATSHDTAGGGKLTWFGDEFLRNVEEQYVKKMLFRATAECEAIVQQLIRQPKSGRVYAIGKGSYTASAPGEAPAVRTGRLRQSIRHVIFKSGTLQWTALIGPTVQKYPSWLEEGTKYMDPRPLWAPALRALSKKMDGILPLDRLP